jgi:WD40 repeat protein
MVRQPRSTVDAATAGRDGGYDVFVSYSHRLDQPVARALQSELQRYARPLFRMRALRVFRDTSNLAAAPEMWASIQSALERSDWFILMASPASAASPWVQREVAWWLENRSADHMLIALVGGDIEWGADGFDTALTDALPTELMQRTREAPRWIDLRAQAAALSDDGDDTRQAGHDPIEVHRLGDVVAEFAAPIHGRDKDTMVGDHIRYARNFRIAVRSIIATLSTLLLVAVLAAIYATRQQAVAETQATIATAGELAAESESLLQTDLATAELLAVAAYRMHPDAQTTEALFRAATYSPSLVRYLAADGPVTAIAGSGDGRVAVAGTQSGSVGRWAVDNGDGMTVTRLPGPVTAVATDIRGDVVAATDATSAMVWSAAQGTQVLSVAPGPDTASVAVSPSGRYVAYPTLTSEGNQALAIADLTDHSVRTVRTPAAADVYLPSDTQIVATDHNGTWQRLSLTNLAVQHQNDRGPYPYGVHSVVDGTSPNGAFFTMSYGNDAIPIWTTSAASNGLGDPQRVGAGHGANPQAIAVSNDGGWIATADAGTIYVSPTGTAAGGAPRFILPGNGNINPKGLTFLGDTNHLLSATGSSVAVWDVGQAGRIATRHPIRVASGCSGCHPPLTEVSPDDTKIIVQDSGTGAVTVEDLTTGEQQTLPAAAGLGVTHGLIGWSGDSSRFYMVGADDAIRVHTTVAGLPVIAIGAAVAPGFAVVPTRTVDAHLVELAGNTVLLQDPLTGRIIQRFDPGPSGASTEDVVATARGSLLAERYSTGGTEATTLELRMVDVGAHRSYPVGSGRAMDYALSSSHLIVTRPSGALEVWSPDGTTLQYTIAQDASYTATGAAEQTAPATRGPLLVQERSDSTFAVTDLDSRAVLGSLALPVATAGRKTSLTFAADGRMISVTEADPSAGDNGLLIVWNMTPAGWVHAACASAGRRLTAAEWTRFVGAGRHADLTCPA